MVALLASAVGCVKPDPAEIVHPLESTLGAAVPAAYFAAASMAALDGRPSPCAKVVTPVGSGSQVRVDVSLGADCPPMFGADESGTVVVTGAWTPQLATFVMDFTGVSYAGRQMVIVGIASMTVVRANTTHLVIAYAEEDIMVGTSSTKSAGIKQVAWVVDVDTVGTDDPSDDAIAMSGGDQTLFAAGGLTPEADLTQVAVGDAVFKPGCRKNPSSGIAAVQRAGTRGGGWVLFRFHDACDGTADVAAALTPYELLITDSLPLAFLQQ
jgi:hypothetical protein